jgi:hypothetical protein
MGANCDVALIVVVALQHVAFHTPTLTRHCVSDVPIYISKVRILEGCINICYHIQAFYKTERLQRTLLTCVSDETVMALTTNVSTRVDKEEAVSIFRV